MVNQMLKMTLPRKDLVASSAVMLSLKYLKNYLELCSVHNLMLICIAGLAV